MKTWQKGVCIGAAVGVAAPFAIVGGLAVAGFGAGGVVAGSAAAGAQAAIGNVAAGSLFASKSKWIKSTVRPWEARFLGNEWIRAAQNRVT